MAAPYLLFGREVAIGLAMLLTTLGKAAVIAVAKPEVITELFDRLGQIEGAAGNLRGALFEMIVAHAVQREGGGSIDIGFRVTIEPRILGRDRRAPRQGGRGPLL